MKLVSPGRHPICLRTPPWLQRRPRTPFSATVAPGRKPWRAPEGSWVPALAPPSGSLGIRLATPAAPCLPSKPAARRRTQRGAHLAHQPLGDGHVGLSALVHHHCDELTTSLLGVPLRARPAEAGSNGDPFYTAVPASPAGAALFLPPLSNVVLPRSASSTGRHDGTNLSQTAPDSRAPIRAGTGETAQPTSLSSSPIPAGRRPIWGALCATGSGPY